MPFYRLKEIKGQTYTDILETLRDGPKSAAQIGRELDLDPHYVRCYLKKLVSGYGCVVPLENCKKTGHIVYGLNAIELPEKTKLFNINLERPFNAKIQ